MATNLFVLLLSTHWAPLQASGLDREVDPKQLCAKNAEFCSRDNRRHVSCESCGSSISRLCCIKAACGAAQDTVYENATSSELQRKCFASNMTNPTTCDTALSWKDSCCTSQLSDGNFMSIPGTPYVEQRELDGEDFQICRRRNRADTEPIPVQFTTNRQKLTVTWDSCRRLVGCKFISIQPQWNPVSSTLSSSTGGGAEDYFFVKIKITVTKGHAFVAPYIESKSTLKGPMWHLVHVDKNTLDKDRPITGVGVVLRSGRMVWDLDIGCIDCSDLSFEFWQDVAQQLTPSVPMPTTAFPDFGVTMAFWDSQEVRLTLSCPPPRDVKGRYPRMIQFSYPPGCFVGNDFDEEFNWDDQGRLTVAWNAEAPCQSFSWMQVYNTTCFSPDCFDVYKPLDCTVDAWSSSLIEEVSRIAVIAMLVFLLLPPAAGLIVTVVRPNSAPTPVPPNIWPLEGDATNKHQVQLLLWPESNQLPSGLARRRMLLFDWVMLALLLIYLLPWLLLGWVDRNTMILCWVPSILLLLVELLMRLKGRTLFAAKAMWKYIVLGICFGIVFSLAT